MATEKFRNRTVSKAVSKKNINTSPARNKSSARFAKNTNDKQKSLNIAAQKQKTLITAVEKQRGLNLRITVIKWLFIIVMTILGMKAIDIQIFKSTDLTRKAEREYIKTITIQGKRGDIMDRNKKRLTTTIDTVSVAAAPSRVTNPAETANALASILKIDKKRLQEQLSTKKSFVWVKRKISPTEAENIKKLKTFQPLAV
ncbi:MAG: hypothetical protein HQK61_11445 [Desulfamplus sp.]|nr:hypothetical protein [Desulfamplus sp.]